MSEEQRDSSMNRQVVDQTIGAHRECMRVVSSLEACLNQSQEDQGSWLGGLCEKLPLLGSTLRAHFQHEQEGYLYRELPLDFPHFAARLERLESEHRRILEAVQDATERSSELNQAETCETHEVRQLHDRVQLLVANIRRHEAEENEILLSAHWRDIGAVD